MSAAAGARSGADGSPSDADRAWADAIAAARLLATDADARLGGARVRAGAGPVRDAWVAAFLAALPGGTPVRRVPVAVDDERLMGGVDLAASLVAGGRVERPGLVAEAAGGVLLVPMAERLAPGMAVRLAGALDRGGARLVALDEGEGEEALHPALGDRLGLWLDLRALPPSVLRAGAEVVAPIVAEGDIAAALVGAAGRLGVGSLRAAGFALAAARAGDAGLAVRTVLAPRAVQRPEPEPPPPPPPPPPDGEPPPDRAETPETAPDDLTELLVAIAAAALPEGALESAGRVAATRGLARSTGRGAAARSLRVGRPAGSRAGDPRRGGRLDVAATLTAAAPWQRLRREALTAAPVTRPLLRADDLRVKRLIARVGTTTVFVVDASGSAALARLAEAKGAVELLLARAYVTRAEVALVAFRGARADVVLPPTRSLARAKRVLGDMVGGGGTPLASAILVARGVARLARARGRTARLVFLTDARGNVPLTEGAPRAEAEADALVAARLLAADGFACVLIDTSPRARGEGARLATAMGARFAALPRVEAGAIVAAAA